MKLTVNSFQMTEPNDCHPPDPGELTGLVSNDDEDVDCDCLDVTNLYEMKLRRRLKFHFMNPIEKWESKQRFPYKFFVQLVKIVLVTLQLCLFAHHRYVHVNYVWDNRLSFSHLFLFGWDATREVSSYPPAIGPLAVYKIDGFFKTIDYAVTNYCNLEEAIGPYTYSNENDQMTPLHLCLYQFKEGDVFGFNESYIFNNEVDETCISINVTKDTCTNFSSRTFLNRTKTRIQFSALLKAILSFNVKTVNLKSAGPITQPNCYIFNISIIFDNGDMDGQMLLSLDTESIRLECKGNTEYNADNKLDSILRSMLNSIVIAVCGISLILCSRAIYRAQLLKNDTILFFKRNYNRDVSPEGKMEFFNMWYLMIIINDLLIIVGSSIKERIEHNQFLSDEWNYCSVLLGVGNLLVWFGILRYLGFFKTYNVVILTLKKAMPKVLRFMICAVIIYAGFTFCGWLILGPYHMKFRSLASTSECLFALINGDDMYATFSMLEVPKIPLIWWYSRLYLYIFITLYIYVVLSLFISVIMDAYDTIKTYYSHGFPKNDIQEFVSECIDEPSSSIFRSESGSSLGDCVGCSNRIFETLNGLATTVCCCKGTPCSVPTSL